MRIPGENEMSGAWLRLSTILFCLPILLCNAAPLLSANLYHSGNEQLLSVDFTLSEGHVIYASSIELKSPNNAISRTDFSRQPQEDELQGTFTLSAKVDGAIAFPLCVSLGYQECGQATCYLPETVNFTFEDEGPGTLSSNRTAPPRTGVAQLEDFLATRKFQSASGYMSAKDFLAWCKNAEQGTARQSFLDKVLMRYGLWLAMLLLIPLGLALNLTPCVLPMLPINVAIICAGKSPSKSASILKSLSFALGMTTAYGGLGLAVILSGSQFGAIAATPAFNFIVAAVFVLLALAMFDVFSIDLSKWRTAKKAGSLAGTFLLGAMNALLSGACVAPVLIWAIILAAQMYAEGRHAGLALPFMLGLGMSLPWPLLAAGLKALPKPGPWMVKVRSCFGIMILCFAAYYATSAIRLLSANSSHNEALPGWHTSLEDAIADAQVNARPLLLFFTGPACKSCKLMQATTLRNRELGNQLANWSKISLSTNSPEFEKLARRFDIIGVPACVVFPPDKQAD